MKKKCTLFALTAVVIGTSAKIIHDTNFFKQNKVVMQTNKWPRGTVFRMVQLSDMHSHSFKKKNKQLLTAINKARPDAVVITGDLIDRRTKRFNLVYMFVESLIGACKRVYFISGNHEWVHPGQRLFMQGLKKRGVTVLDKTVVELSQNHYTMRFAGLGYETEITECPDSPTPTVNESTYTVSLMHTPAVDNVLNEEADLMLCGHTHGGQIRFPLIGAVVAPDQGLFPKWAKGLYPLENNQFLYVDSGFGTTHLPVRLFNQSQFSVIDINGHG